MATPSASVTGSPVSAACVQVQPLGHERAPAAREQPPTTRGASPAGRYTPALSAGVSRVGALAVERAQIDPGRVRRA